MDLIADGDYDAFATYIHDTGNTICGRSLSFHADLTYSHPIGVMMCALAVLKEMGVEGKWHFIKYEQSSHVEDIRDTSVSYVSAYWTPTK